MINNHVTKPFLEKFAQDNAQLIKGKVTLDFISWDLGRKSKAESSGKMAVAMHSSLSPETDLNPSHPKET